MPFESKKYALGVLRSMHEGTRSSNHGIKPKPRFESELEHLGGFVYG